MNRTEPSFIDGMGGGMLLALIVFCLLSWAFCWGCCLVQN